MANFLSIDLRKDYLKNKSRGVIEAMDRRGLSLSLIFSINVHFGFVSSEFPSQCVPVQ